MPTWQATDPELGEFEFDTNDDNPPSERELKVIVQRLKTDKNLEKSAPFDPNVQRADRKKNDRGFLAGIGDAVGGFADEVKSGHMGEHLLDLASNPGQLIDSGSKNAERFLTAPDIPYSPGARQLQAGVASVPFLGDMYTDIVGGGEEGIGEDVGRGVTNAGMLAAPMIAPEVAGALGRAPGRLGTPLRSKALSVAKRSLGEGVSDAAAAKALEMKLGQLKTEPRMRSAVMSEAENLPVGGERLNEIISAFANPLPEVKPSGLQAALSTVGGAAAGHTLFPGIGGTVGGGFAGRMIDQSVIKALNTRPNLLRRAGVYDRLGEMLGGEAPGINLPPNVPGVLAEETPQIGTSALRGKLANLDPQAFSEADLVGMPPEQLRRPAIKTAEELWAEQAIEEAAGGNKLTPDPVLPNVEPFEPNRDFLPGVSGGRGQITGVPPDPENPRYSRMQRTPIEKYPELDEPVSEEGLFDEAMDEVPDIEETPRPKKSKKAEAPKEEVSREAGDSKLRLSKDKAKRPLAGTKIQEKTIRKNLESLGYSEDQISRMEPETAQEIVLKNRKAANGRPKDNPSEPKVTEESGYIHVEIPDPANPKKHIAGLSAKIEDGKMHVSGVSVDKKFRGRGLGSKLYEKLGDEMKSRGVSEFFEDGNILDDEKVPKMRKKALERAKRVDEPAKENQSLPGNEMEIARSKADLPYEFGERSTRMKLKNPRMKGTNPRFKRAKGSASQIKSGEMSYDDLSGREKAYFDRHYQPSGKKRAKIRPGRSWERNLTPEEEMEVKKVGKRTENPEELDDITDDFEYGSTIPKDPIDKRAKHLREDLGLIEEEAYRIAKKLEKENIRGKTWGEILDLAKKHLR